MSCHKHLPYEPLNIADECLLANLNCTLNSLAGHVYTGRDGGDRGIGNKTIPRTEEEIGEGAAFSLASCSQSFDGLSACGVNDKTFIYNAAARRGGAVVIAGANNATTYVEFHRCFINASTTGSPIENDPQGEGGAFALGHKTTLVLEDCMVTNNYCGKKVGILFFPDAQRIGCKHEHSLQTVANPACVLQKCRSVPACARWRWLGGGRVGSCIFELCLAFRSLRSSEQTSDLLETVMFFPRLNLFFERFPPCFLFSDHTFKDVLQLGWGTAERY